jgi:hypothetical protein
MSHKAIFDDMTHPKTKISPFPAGITERAQATHSTGLLSESQFLNCYGFGE